MWNPNHQWIYTPLPTHALMGFTMVIIPRTIEHDETLAPFKE
jgi:hypothetical protein